MKKVNYVLIWIMFVLSIILFIRFTLLSISPVQISDIRLTSPDFLENESMPELFSCRGFSVNPPMVFSNVPSTAKSLVITMEDPDAPFRTVYHWLLWNIPIENVAVVGNTIPRDTVQGTSSFGDRIYRGPCPAFGSHHYIFRLYALDTILPLTNEAKIGDLKSAMKGHIVGQTHLTGIYP